MTNRKPKFVLTGEPTIWFRENRIEAEVSLSFDEIKQLAPQMVSLLDSLAGSGVNVEIEGEISITIKDVDLYTGQEDVVKNDD